MRRCRANPRLRPRRYNRAADIAAYQRQSARKLRREGEGSLATRSKAPLRGRDPSGLSERHDDHFTDAINYLRANMQARVIIRREREREIERERESGMISMRSLSSQIRRRARRISEIARETRSRCLTPDAFNARTLKSSLRRKL